MPKVSSNCSARMTAVTPPEASASASRGISITSLRTDAAFEFCFTQWSKVRSVDHHCMEWNANLKSLHASQHGLQVGNER